MSRYPQFSKISLLALGLMLSACGKHSNTYYGLSNKPTGSGNPQKQTPSEEMNSAIRSDDLTAVTKLVSEGFALDFRLSGGRTPLHIAVESNKVRIVRFLFSKGADPTLVDDEGRSSLDLAAGKPEIIRIISPDAEFQQKAEMIQAVQADDKVKIKLYLVTEKRDPNFIDSVTGQTPLTLAIQLRFAALVRTMIQTNTKTDVDLKNAEGFSPLQMSRLDPPQPDIEKMLKQRKAKEN